MVSSSAAWLELEALELDPFEELALELLEEPELQPASAKQLTSAKAARAAKMRAKVERCVVSILETLSIQGSLGGSATRLEPVLKASAPNGSHGFW